MLYLPLECPIRLPHVVMNYLTVGVSDDEVHVAVRSAHHLEKDKIAQSLAHTYRMYVYMYMRIYRMYSLTANFRWILTT